MDENNINKAIQIADKNCRLSSVDGRWRLQFTALAKLHNKFDNLKLEAFFDNQNVAERQLAFMKVIICCHILNVEYSAEDMQLAIEKHAAWEQAIHYLTLPY